VEEAQAEADFSKLPDDYKSAAGYLFSGDEEEE